jgi:hypothetical protein
MKDKELECDEPNSWGSGATWTANKICISGINDILILLKDTLKK